MNKRVLIPSGSTSLGCDRLPKGTDAFINGQSNIYPALLYC